MPDAAPDPSTDLAFGVFNEIGIIAQLSTALFEARLPDGFLVSHFAVLNHLVRVKDGRTPLDIARAFQVPKNTMTHTLATLERHGLVRFEPNPEDGRSKLVRITEAGRSFRADAIASLSPDVTRLGGLVAPDTLEALLPPLRHLRETLDRMRD